MKRDKILLILITVLISISSHALTCPKEFKPVQVSLELLKLDFSGARVDGMEDNKCLKQSNHPYIQAVYDPSNEESSAPQYYISKSTKINIDNIKLVDKDTYTYQVTFSYKAIDASKKEKTISNTMQFFLYKDEENIKTHGCAGLIVPPDVITLYRSCRE